MVFWSASKLESATNDNAERSDAGDGGAPPMSGTFNTIIEHVWPYANRFVKELLLTEIQPKLKEALPSAMKSLGFDKDRCSLGPNPLRFENIIIEKAVTQTYRGPMENCSMRCAINWDADTELYLQFMGASFGVEALRFKGTLVIELVSLVPKPPFFNGMRVFFHETPEVDIEFGGVMDNMLNLQLVRSKLQEVIGSVLNEQVVAPNRLGFTLSPDGDIFNIKCPPSKGMLKVKVVGATGLKGADFSWTGAAKSDPYVVLRFASDVYESPVKSGTVNPEWDWDVTLLVGDIDHQKCNITIMDEDALTGGDFLGKLSVPVRTMVQWSCRGKKDVQLRDQEGTAGQSGSVRLVTEWVPLVVTETGSDVVTDECGGVVICGIESAAALPRGVAGSTYWVEVDCTEKMNGFHPEALHTQKVSEPEADVSEESDGATPRLKLAERVKLLQECGVPEHTMAKVLQVDLEQVRRATVEAADEADEKSQRVPELKWEHGFEFPVHKCTLARLNFVVWRQAPAEEETPAEEIGTFTYDCSALKDHVNHTKWETFELDNNAVVKVKVGLRFFGKQAGDA